MKKSVILLLPIILVLTTFVSAECNLDATLINQDPYPAQPGDSVKVVFQLTGIQDSSCGKVRFSLLEEYPFSLDPGARNLVEIQGGTFISGYKSHLLVPYKLRVDKNAVEGENPLTILYSSGQQAGSSVEEEFNITVEDSRTEFEVHINDYSIINKRFVLEILNTGESDAEAVTIEIPDQENVNLLGSKRSIVGEVDSNEEEVVSFDGTISEGKIDVIIIYTDQTNERRTIQESVIFRPENFPEVKEGGNLSAGNSFIIGLLIPIIIYFIYRWRKKHKDKHKRHPHHARHHGM